MLAFTPCAWPQQSIPSVDDLEATKVSEIDSIAVVSRSNRSAGLRIYDCVVALVIFFSDVFLDAAALVVLRHEPCAMHVLLLETSPRALGEVRVPVVAHRRTMVVVRVRGLLLAARALLTRAYCLHATGCVYRSIAQDELAPENNQAVEKQQASPAGRRRS